MEKFSPNPERKNINQKHTKKELSNILEKSSENISTQLNSLKESMENLKEYNDELLQANKLIREILKNPSENNFSLIDKANKLLYTLLSPAYKENSLQKSYAKILWIINLANWVEATTEEIQIWIKNVLTDPNLPYIIKRNFVNWLKEKDFLMWDPLERVKIQNYCETNFPKYNWNTFQIAIDPKDWNIMYTDMFAQM